MVDSDLTAQALRELLDYEPATGRFVWRVWRGGGSPKAGAMAGSYAPAHAEGQAYIRIGVGRKYHLAHRLAWLYMTGDWPTEQIDHVNGKCDDNRFANLRDVPRSQNQQNIRSARRQNSSGLLGAHRFKGRWQARITVSGKRHFLGLFDTAAQASSAYLAAKHRLHACAPK